MKSISRGIIAILVVAAILLVSDLQNRKAKKTGAQPVVKTGSEAAVGRKYTLGLCYFAPEPSHDQLLSGLWKRLEELGFVRDSNLIVKDTHANGEIGNIAQILQNMDNQPMDLLLVTSTPCVTAALATIKKHPVAFTYCYDPVAAGAGKSYEDHLPGITGIGSFPPVEKTIRFILETIPGTKKIGTIYNTSEANSRKVVGVMRQLAEKSGFTLVEMPVTNSSEVFQAAQVIASKGIDALYVSGDNTALQAFDAIAGVCNKSAIPLVVNDLPYVGMGAFAGIGIGWQSVGYHSGDLIGRLLNGASPASIPMENYVDESVTFDMDKANSLGLKIPGKYLSDHSLPRGRKYKLCLAQYSDNDITEEAERGLRQALKDFNLVEGVDFTLKEFNAQGDIGTLNSIAGSVSNESWDLVFCSSTPTAQMMARKLPGDVKIVFTNVGDPVMAGLAKSFEDHQANITGIATMSDFEGMIRLVRFLQPDIKRVGTVFTPGEINSVSYKTNLEIAATAQGMELISVPANSSTEVLDAAKSMASQRIGAFCQISDNLTGSCSAAILKVAMDSNLPYYGFVTRQLGQGALAVCARDYFQAGYEAVEMGIEVLAGKNPALIPIRLVRKTDYLMNVKVARQLKINLDDRLTAAFPTMKLITE